MLFPHPISIAPPRRSAIALWDSRTALETSFHNTRIARIWWRPSLEAPFVDPRAEKSPVR